MSGPVGPGVGQALSSQVASWRFATSATARALAPRWAAGATATSGDALLVVDTTTSQRRLYVYTATGTAGATVPTFTGPGTDGVSAVGFALGGGASNGMALVNEDGTNYVRIGNPNVQNAGVPPGLGYPMPAGDPSLVYVVAAAGTPVVSVAAWL